MAATSISIENRKGGVGKTTTAVILATALARHLADTEARVLLMDTDPQGDAATALNVDPGQRCISQLLLQKAAFSEVILPIPPTDDNHSENLYLLPATDQLTEALTQLNYQIGATKAANPQQPSPTLVAHFTTVMAPLKQAFAYIIIDCPPSLGLLREAIHHFADYAIVPVRPDYHSVYQTARHTHDLLDDQADGMPIRLLAITPTFVQSQHRLTKEMMHQLREAYGSLLTPPIPLTTAVAQAPAVDGRTVLDHEPGSAAALAYQALVDRVLTL